MRIVRLYRSLAGLFVVPLAAVAHGQGTLSLDDALRLARERNGTVRAALLDVEAAGERVTQARSAFLPEIVPLWRYDDTRQTGPSFPTAFTSRGSSSELSTRWRLLDSGQRQWSLSASRASASAERLFALQTMRQVLFTVHQQYFDALRTDELLRVASAQVERAAQILAQTEAQVRVGDAPEKDVFQARADFLNAKVQELVAKNRTATAQAALKATIGWEPASPFPELVAKERPGTFPEVEPLAKMVERGVEERPDLGARRFLLDAQKLGARRTDREAGVTWALDASYNRSLSPDTADSRVVTFLVSMPLFDGGLSRAAAREARAGVDSAISTLEQSEREAVSEIEAAHSELTQNAERLGAAQAAVEAARKNYEAAVEAQKAGAAGTNVVTVLTAQVSLVTAESNFVEALYDYFIADVRLRVATGQPVPGEGPTG